MVILQPIKPFITLGIMLRFLSLIYCQYLLIPWLFHSHNISFSTFLRIYVTCFSIIHEVYQTVDPLFKLTSLTIFIPTTGTGNVHPYLGTEYGEIFQQSAAPPCPRYLFSPLTMFSSVNCRYIRLTSRLRFLLCESGRLSLVRFLAQYSRTQPSAAKLHFVGQDEMYLKVRWSDFGNRQGDLLNQ